MCDWTGWRLEHMSTAAEHPTVEYVQPPAQQGWQCPKCGRINAPWVATCPCYLTTAKPFVYTVGPTCKDNPTIN